MGFRNGEFSFHIWHRDPKTGVRKWCGQFLDDKSALGWKKKQEHPEEFTINNVGPSAVYKASPEGKAKAAKENAERERRRKEQQERFERIRNGEVEKTNRPATKTTPRVIPSVAHTPLPKAKPKPVPVPETKEQKRLKADAAKVLEKHKRDEAADLKQGINR